VDACTWMTRGGVGAGLDWVCKANRDRLLLVRADSGTRCGRSKKERPGSRLNRYRYYSNRALRAGIGTSSVATAIADVFEKN